MSENIILEPGAKVRQAGQSYKVVDTAVISGELVPVQAQTNRHMAFYCPDPLCREQQKQRNHGRFFKGRMAFGTSATYRFQCGDCGKPVMFETEVNAADAATE